MTDDAIVPVEPALITMGQFQIGRLGLTVHGEPTLGEWAEAGRALAQVRSASQWAIGDLLLYADTRGWNDDEVQAVLSTLNLKRGTLANLKSVARAFPFGTRMVDLPWTHHALVQSLGNEDATALLERSVSENWGYDEIRAHARAQRQQDVRQAQAWPEGTYGVVLACPPWRPPFGEAPQTDQPPMLTEAISALTPRVQAIMAPDCICYLSTREHLLEDGLAVLRAWGFTLVSTMTMVDDLSVLTDWSRRRHTTVLVGTRGNPAPPEEDARPDSVFRRWSELYDMIDLCYPAAPKVELFGGDIVRDNWASWSMAPEAAPERSLVVEGV